MNVRKITAIAGVAAAIGLGLGACGSSGPSVNLSKLQSSVQTAAQGQTDDNISAVSCSPGSGSTAYLCMLNDGGQNVGSVTVTLFANGSWTGSAGIQWASGSNTNDTGTAISG